MNEITEEEYDKFLEGASEIVRDYDIYHDIAGNFSHRIIFIKNGKLWSIEHGKVGDEIFYFKPKSIDRSINIEDIDVRKKADEWYNRGILPCRREMQQDICAWQKDTDEQFKQVITTGFFYGYMKALEDVKKL